MTSRYTAYIASPLTGLDDEAKADLERKLELLNNVCYEYGIDTYNPGKFTDPDKNPEIKPYIVYQTDRNKVRTSDLFVLLAMKPSFGAGQEVEIAYNSLVPMIIIYPQDSKLSRMVTGIPTKLKYSMSFDDEETLIANFRKGLSLLKPHIEKRRLDLTTNSQTTIGDTIKLLRSQKGLKVEEMASHLGIFEEEAKFIEENSNFAVNLSFTLATKIAESLQKDPAEVLFNDFYNREMTEIASKMVKIIKKLPFTEIVGNRNKKHEIKDTDLLTMIMRLAMEEN